MPGRFDKSLTVDSDWATDFCGSEDFIRSNGLWAGATIYNTSDQALPIALGRTHGAADLDTLWHGFDNDTSIVGERFRTFLDLELIETVGELYGEPSPQKANRTNCTRACGTSGGGGSRTSSRHGTRTTSI